MKNPGEPATIEYRPVEPLQINGKNLRSGETRSYIPAFLQFDFYRLVDQTKELFRNKVNRLARIFFVRQGKENRAYQEVCKVFLDAV